MDEQRTNIAKSNGMDARRKTKEWKMKKKLDRGNGLGARTTRYTRRCVAEQTGRKGPDDDEDSSRFLRSIQL